ncbi:MAG: hypothetical protein NT027_12045 [Proteobacteria bacterium]|nr:hypothetical protein [Pseudomonadota bacterium]
MLVHHFQDGADAVARKLEFDPFALKKDVADPCLLNLRTDFGSLAPATKIILKYRLRGARTTCGETSRIMLSLKLAVQTRNVASRTCCTIQRHDSKKNPAM